MNIEKIKQKVSKYGWEEGFGLEEYQVDWLIEQAEKVEKLRGFLRAIYNLSVTEINAGYEISHYLESAVFNHEE